MKKQNAELALEAGLKIFNFEDIITINDPILERVLRGINRSVLALALKNASEAIKEKIYHNISDRLRDILREDVAVLRYAKEEKIAEAQRLIINELKKIEKNGENIFIEKKTRIDNG